MSTARVSLPMYNLPEMRATNTAFWQAIGNGLARRGLGGLPEQPEFGRKPVTQTCARLPE